MADTLLAVESLDVYYGKTCALRDVSLNVAEGEVVAVLGPNGAGKTTLLRTISGLIRPTSGRIVWQGEDIAASPPDKVVGLGIIHVPQGRRVFPNMTVQENLEMGLFLRRFRERPEDSLARVYALFPVLKERRRQLAGTLSGGEQQMLAIGRGLMGSPRLLMLDEPSLGLAPIMVETLYAKIAEIASSGVTILLVEQNAVRALGVARRAYFLEAGRVTLSGDASGLREQDVVKAYLGTR